VAWLSGAAARKTKDTARTRGQAASFANAVDMVKPAVITVRAKRRVDTSVGEQSVVNPPDEPHGKSSPGSPGRRRGATSLGSGFFVTADGYAVTNNHVTGGPVSTAATVNCTPSSPVESDY
jgi:serine protease Do